MHTHRKHRQFVAGIFALAFSLVFFSGVALAQGVTTAGISGFLSGPGAKAVSGARVTAVDVNSGTRSVTTSNTSGYYNLAGLRPGGPYTVTVSATGLQEQSKTDIYLDVGANYEANFDLTNVEGGVVNMAAYTVAASRDTTFDSSIMGTGSTYGAGQIANEIGSVRQDIQDVVNTDPRVDMAQSANDDEEYTISIQGQNPRENLVLVDGVSATDNFGLNSNGYAGLRSPLPLPWIESLAIKLNDYDVTYSGYLGGIIDSTLKSGSNEFHGSLYTMYEGTNFRGADPTPGVANPHELVQDHTTGATFSGPIIKDKLFFFVGYEAFREITAAPAQTFIADDNPTDTAIINQILAKAQSLGDTSQGTFNAGDHVWEQNFVAKLDWNISDSQKFEVTFRHTAGQSPLYYNYTSSFETSLSGSWYNSYRVDQSITAKLNSDWSSIIPGLSTEIEATYKRYNGTATLNGTDWADVTVYLETPNTPSGNVGTSLLGGSPPYELYLGPSPNYQANALHTNEQEMHGYAEYAIGDHTLKFGIQSDETLFNNTFIPDYLGAYTFSNIADFLNQTPTGYTLAQPYPGYTLASAIAHGQITDFEPMIQDTWKPIPDLTLLFGARMDYPYMPQKPILSQDFLTDFGYTNQGTINGNYTISPRFGFNYTLPGDKKTQIRGGAGLFLGENPLVWLENAYSTGGQIGTSSKSNSTVPIPGFTFTGAGSQPSSVAAPTALQNIDDVNPDFHWPANWKENLAIDRELPWWHLIFTAEVDYSQVQKGIYYKDLNLAQATTGPAFMPDGAIRYAGNVTPTNIGSTNYVPTASANSINITTWNSSGAMSNSSTYSTSSFYSSATSLSSSGPLLLHSNIGAVEEVENTDKGGSQEYTLMLRRPMIDDWDFSFAWTHTHATEVASLGGTTAAGSYDEDAFLNPGADTLGRSLWAVPDKFVLTVDKRFHFFKLNNSATTISAQFIAQTGQPYSFVFEGDADGSGNNNTDDSLFYVPTGPSDPKVTWLSPTEEANFFQWLAGTPELAKYAGQVAPRNAFYSGEQHTVNLHFEQQLPIYGPFRVTLFADCFNFANLIDKNWGLIVNYGDYEGGLRTVAGTGYNALGDGGQGQYIYVFNHGTLNEPTVYADESRWALQVGARLEF